MRNMIERKIVEVIEFTDPVCTWCWGEWTAFAPDNPHHSLKLPLTKLNINANIRYT